MQLPGEAPNYLQTDGPINSNFMPIILESGKYSAHPWLKQLCEEGVTSALPVLQGDIFPDLEFPLMSGDTLSINELLGERLTIIDLWASWCAPCRKENHEVLVPLLNQYHDHGEDLLGFVRNYFDQEK